MNPNDDKQNSMTAIVWFRRDLRLHDNLALIAAAGAAERILPVYVFDKQDDGGASRWWLHESLQALQNAIRSRGGSLQLLQGDPASLIAALVEEYGARSVHYSRRYEPIARQQESDLQRRLGDDIEVCAENDSYLIDPDRVMTQGGTAFKVFTPFWKTASEQPVDRPRPVPDKLAFVASQHATFPLDELCPLPGNPDWATGIREAWQPGENEALQRLDDIDAAAEDYARLRDRPDLDATSRLSPHLHFGEISARQVVHALRMSQAKGAAALLRQLYWRDFSGYLLYHNPELPDTPLRPEFENFPWVDDPEALRAWQSGNTGYPIVDAGMRQLWATGWMHNRVRMIVASFLVKDLMVPWQQGAEWFMDTLVDADLANNSASWQWVAGCGTDAAPYFRIFNPVLQGNKFDPNGDYVRRWLPALADLPAKFVHQPWQADRESLRAAKLVLGENYPMPIVDHGLARENALQAYQFTRDSVV